MSERVLCREVREGRYVVPASPVCTHCGGFNLKRNGTHKGKQVYHCRDCQRYSRGVVKVDDGRPLCRFCGNRVKIAKRLPPRRFMYRCLTCGRGFVDIPVIAYKEPVRCPHRFAFMINDAARAKLMAYCAATGFSEPMAVRAIFRRVMQGGVFWIFGSPSRRGSRTPPRPVESEAARVTMVLPDLRSETARRQWEPTRRRVGKPNAWGMTIAGAGVVTVALDDAAKEGLVHAMGMLGMNHADAARWLLANAEIPAKK
ncbi:MAG: hypothetical protein H7Y38_00595 [Armatimonadetes bacterium]|nr:hypothetical protein [Armatimonadota bacterium]